MPWRGPDEPGSFPTLGFQVADWIEAHCAIPDGNRAGEPFLLTDEMVRFLLWFYRLHPDALPDPDRPSRAFVHDRGSQLVRPQKWGKGPFSAAEICAEAEGPVLFDGWDADGEPVGRPWSTPWIQVTAVSEDQPLALDTPVPTPTGWSTVDGLQVGDVVLDQAGCPVPIRRATGVLEGHPCYEVAFSDGERVVASERHGWTVERLRAHADRHEVVTLTTAELVESLTDSKGRKRLRVPAGVPWQLPDHDLPVDPWLLGMWLGDGATNDSRIAYDARLRGEYETLVKDVLLPREEVVWGQGPGNQGTFRVRRPSGSLRVRLRDLGVLGAKHIPLLYLRSGHGQRLSLLQGLIDSDGHLEPNGRATFTNADRRLIDDVGELLTTLGIGWRRRQESQTGAWRVQFVPTSEMPVARLAHKVARHRTAQRSKRLSQWRHVTSVVQVASVPVRCVGIDTDEHLFLVGRRAVPTHNTDNVWLALVPMIELGELKADIPDTGQTRINLASGGKIEPVTSSARSRLGQRITFAVQDEAHSWTAQNGGRKLADNQRRNLAGMGGRWMETGNAWDPIEESVAQKTWESKAPGVYKDRSEPGPGSVRNKRERRKCMVRAYGDSAQSDPSGRWTAWVDLDRIDSEIVALIEQGDPSQAERFFLNRDQSIEGSAFDYDRWKSLGSTAAIPDGELIVIGADGARVDDAFALIATDVISGHQWPLGIWEVPQGASEDYEHPEHEIDGAMLEAFDTWDVWRVYADPWRGDTLLDRWIGRWGEQTVIRWFMNRPKQVAYAVRNFASAISRSSLTHNGDPTYSRHVAQARKQLVAVYDDDRRQMWTIAKDRPMSPRKIDAAAAGVISWEARGDAIAAGAEKSKESASLPPLVFGM